MHGTCAPYHPRAVCARDDLVSQADAQDGDGAGAGAVPLLQGLDQLQAVAAFQGRLGPRRDDHALQAAARGQAEHLGHLERVVANDADIASELGKVAGQGMDERIVVVDHEVHGDLPGIYDPTAKKRLPRRRVAAPASGSLPNASHLGTPRSGLDSVYIKCGSGGSVGR